MRKALVIILLLAFISGLFACSDKDDAKTTDGVSAVTHTLTGAVESTEKAQTEGPATISESDEDLTGVWTGTKDVDFDEEEIITYNCTLTVGEDGTGEFHQSWTDGGVAKDYYYTLTVSGDTMRMHGKESLRNGERVDIAIEDMVEFSVRFSIDKNKIEIGAAYDYDTDNFDMSYYFPATLQKTK